MSKKNKNRKLLAVRILEENGETYVRVTHQTHIGEHFGLNGCEFPASNGLTLMSLCGPDYSSCNSLFLVRGHNKWEHHRKIPIKDSEYLHKIKEAVEEYNRFWR